jgi:flagellar biosynthesis protein FlhG
MQPAKDELVERQGFTVQSKFKLASPKPREASIIAIGGGKGGIGKTLLTANLGICFARKRKKVVLVDADLGGSNLHTCLGTGVPSVSLSDFVQRRVDDIEDVIVQTGIEGLGLISGAQDFLASANIKYTQKMRVLSQIKKINADLILLDLGSGTSFNVLDFFLVSDLGVVTMMPEPTSIENSYRFIKSAFYRLLRHREKSLPFQKIIEEAMASRNSRDIKTPYDLIRVIGEMDAQRGISYQDYLSAFQPLLVINQVRADEDRELGVAVQTACRKYFGIDLDYVGYLTYDDAVWKAVRGRSAVMQAAPNSPIAISMMEIANRIGSKLEKMGRVNSGRVDARF